ncbi:MAG TPA: potassium channel family protein [Chondromyces sp.]|nr:potassium channel family protein [Chondromyces sp.]
MLSNALIILTIVFMVVNLYSFLNNKSYKKSYFKPSLFYRLFFNFAGMTFGFAFIYYLLSQNNVILRVSSPTGEAFDPTFWDLVYFSGVTLLSIGYGDYIPVGNVRFFALIEGSIGLLLPTAYFVKAMSESKDKK